MYASTIGLKYEVACAKELILMRYLVGRTKASRGPFDVFACNGKEFLFIQVKKTNGANPAASTWKPLRDLQLPANARKQVWIHTRHNQWKVIDL